MKKFSHSVLLLLLACSSLLRAQERKMEEVQPVTILGGGVGALTSAVYLQRAGINTIVLEGSNPGGAIAQSPVVHNWPGEIAIEGQVLVDKIRKQALHNGAKILPQEVIKVDFSKRPFTITTREVFDKEKTHTFKTHACIIATGSMPKLLGVPGESGDNGYWTRGVYSCAVCDGALYKDKIVAVIGGGDSAITEANYLSKIAKKVYIVLRSDKFRTIETLRRDELLKKANVEILYNTKISEIQGDGNKVTHLNISPSRQLQIDGIFVAIGATPNSSIFTGQLELDETGYIASKNGLQTSVPGVFAIGDVVDKVYKQAISAAGDGAKAALEAEAFLSTLQLKPATQIVSSEPKTKEQATETIIAVKNPSTDSDGLNEITSKEAFYEEIASGSTPVLFDFYSPFCGPCKQLLPHLEQSADAYQGKIRFFKVNVSDLPELATSYNINSVPTVLVFDMQGKVIEKAEGLDAIQKVLKKLDSIAQKTQ